MKDVRTGTPMDTHHGIPKDGENYSPLRRQTGFSNEKKRTNIKGRSMEAAKGTETTGTTGHTHLRSNSGFDPGSSAESNQHVGDKQTGIGDGPAPFTGVEKHDHGSQPRAEHLPKVDRSPHKFDRPPTGPTSGFGHAAHQRSGHLRMSGKAGAHRIGRGK